MELFVDALNIEIKIPINFYARAKENFPEGSTGQTRDALGASLVFPERPTKHWSSQSTAASPNWSRRSGNSLKFSLCLDSPITILHHP